jgi:hypothetical protein
LTVAARRAAMLFEWHDEFYTKAKFDRRIPAQRPDQIQMQRDEFRRK